VRQGRCSLLSKFFVFAATVRRWTCICRAAWWHNRFAGHSLRSGGGTHLLAVGVPAVGVARIRRWRDVHVLMRLYDRRSSTAISVAVLALATMPTASHTRLAQRATCRATRRPTPSRLREWQRGWPAMGRSWWQWRWRHSGQCCLPSSEVEPPVAPLFQCHNAPNAPPI
jgi:hypothetical protein